MAACRTCKNAAVQHPTYLFTRFKNSQTANLSVCPSPPCTTAIYRRKHHACMHACMQNLQNRQAGSQTGAAGFTKSGRSCMAACRTCKNAAVQHPTYLFTRCKNSQTGNLSVCPSPPCTVAIYRENTMHACRTCKTGRQAAKRALPDLLSRAGAAWQHAGHAIMQRCSILHTYSLDAKTRKLQTCLFAPAHHAQPLSIGENTMHACMHACRTCKTGRHAAKRALPDLLSRAGAAWQHAGHARMQRCSILHTYSLDAKTHKLETCLFAPAHHAQSLSIEKTAMHACRTCKTGRQAAKRTLPDLLSRAGAAWQHAGHARMQRCSILHTYSLDAKTHKLETCLFAPAHHAQSLSIEKTPCMHACRTCKTGRQAAKRALPDLLSRAGAAWQHAGHARMQRCSILHTYSLDAKTRKLQTCLFAPAHHAQPLSIGENTMHACMQNLQNRQACSQTGAAGFTKSGRSCMAACRTCKNAAVQHPTYLFTRCKNSQTGNLSVCPSPPCTVAIYRENRHACMQNLQNRQAGSQTDAAGFTKSGRSCMAACRTCKNAAVQHPTYLFTRCKNSQTRNWSVCPSPPCTAAIYRENTMHAEFAKQAGRQPNGRCRIY